MKCSQSKEKSEKWTTVGDINVFLKIQDQFCNYSKQCCTKSNLYSLYTYLNYRFPLSCNCKTTLHFAPKHFSKTIFSHFRLITVAQTPYTMDCVQSNYFPSSNNTTSLTPFYRCLIVQFIVYFADVLMVRNSRTMFSQCLLFSS